MDVDPEDREQINNIAGEVDVAGQDPKMKKKDKKQTEVNDQVEEFKLGNVGALADMSKKQFGNVKSLATNPSQFIMFSFMKKFAKAGIAIGIGLLILEIVNYALDQSMEAGRWLDRRFKRIAQNEVMLFFTRKEQEEARRGFSEMRVTSIQGLRGGMGQVNGNLFMHAVIGNHSYPSQYRAPAQQNLNPMTSKGFATNPNGSPRGGHRGGGFAGNP